MINKDKWIDSLPGKNTRISNTINQLDHDKWIKTIPKKKSHNSVRKYSLMSFVFVCGLLFVSAIKNETRNLQKEINNLETSINLIKFNLDQAFLDNEVITSPENISRLAKEYLNINFISYKRNQIERLSDDMDVISEPVEKSVSLKWTQTSNNVIMIKEKDRQVPNGILFDNSFDDFIFKNKA